MRHVMNAKREKNTYNLSLDEFKSGVWLDKIKDASDLLELSFKKGWLVISDAKITEISGKGEKNGKREITRVA